ncbi:pyruvate kinase [Halorussus gelatinilyticus]|uniref:Pyruvate kinase n=1 Tax=Halorussus gelatinilyticus TaxID=2937524 RepID=A0A8U0IEH0_9EURY|nr:pyruvate kinase [Halorussus gelatinilyticus]UPV99080.1 pyruvate kinase [Halorussus gelatinilyticus]
MRNAKIVCTLGPASDSRRTIRELADAGMTVARLNASHGTREDREEIVDHVRDVDETTADPLAVMVDLQGPEIRTAETDEPVHLETDSTVRFVKGDTATPEEVGLSYSITNVEPGDKVLLDDGRIETVVEEVEDGDGEGVVVARVVSGGDLSSRKGVNVPGVDLDLDVVTEKDRRDLELAAEKQADFVAASFVRSAEDVLAVNEVLEELGADIPIVAKIERRGAVENLDEIVDAAYGVMVARGDLGVECPLEDVPMIQKRIIRECQQTGTPVITATEMLDSMVHARRPTRAEASDVANAVLDGTDAVMLSGETAIGDDPVRVVETMDRIVREVEESDEYDEIREQRVPAAEDARTDALARSARYLARDIGAAAIVAASESGYTALKVSKFRPQVPVVATTPNDEVRRQLALSWGVNAQYTPLAEGVDTIIDDSVQAALDAGVAESGDTVVVVSGMMSELEGTSTTNMLKVHVAAETIGTGRSVVRGRVAGPVARTDDGDLSDVPEGSILALEPDFDGEFDGDASKLLGIVDARPGMTGYPAMVARELDIPMVSGAPLDPNIRDGDVVTLDAERGVVYDGDVTLAERERP